MDLTETHNTPLVVNILRLIRNARLPRSSGEGRSTAASSSFGFGGLRMVDCGPFMAAESVWATHSLRASGRGAQGCTFAGPLHLLVCVDEATVEHWTVSDGRGTHTENSTPRSYDQLESLNVLVRILFTQLRGGDVYASLRRREAASSDEISAAGDEVPLIAKSHQEEEGVVRNGGVELVVFGEGDSAAAARGLLEALHAEEADAAAIELTAGTGTGCGARPATTCRYRSRMWEEDDLVRVTAVTDTLWQTVTASRASPSLEVDTDAAAGETPASDLPTLQPAAATASTSSSPAPIPLAKPASSAHIATVESPPLPSAPPAEPSTPSAIMATNDFAGDMAGGAMDLFPVWQGHGDIPLCELPHVAAQGLRFFTKDDVAISSHETAAALCGFCEQLALDVAPPAAVTESFLTLLD